MMVRNPVITGVAGVLLGFFVGFVVGQRQGVVPQMGGGRMGDPHAGVPGAPPLSGMPPQGSDGGHAASPPSPQLLEAARELERLLAEDPNNYEHLVQMGNVQYDLGNWSRAVDFYERARAIRDDSADVMTDLAVAYRESGQSAKAIELLDRAADMKPEHWQSRYNAAVVRLFDLNDTAGALEEVAKLKALRGTIKDIPDLAPLEQEILRRQR
ncbi:MAG: tetratricopeptide repeat protein [Acidobacteriota bacterium]